MKSPLVNTLVPNENVTAQFLVLSKEIRQKKTGEPYLALHLADRTGEIEAKMWDNVAEVMHTFDRDHFVKVKGLPQVYNNRSQFIIHRLRRLADHEVEFADYFPCSERNPEEMFEELRGIIAGIGDSHLRALLNLVFDDEQLVALYKIAPAAKSIHHACRGGLLEHVLSLCTLARLVGDHYPEVDSDLLLTGVILHDIGKVEELSYERSFGYSTEGQLLGHIVLGLRLIASRFERLPDFPPKLRTLIEHLVISHHGELEFGSPKVPLFPEALLLHHLDNLDSKMNAMRTVLKRDSLADGEFTGWIPSLERVLLRKERYLKATTIVQPPAPAAEAPVAAASAASQSEPAAEPPPPVIIPAPAAPSPVRATPRPAERKPEPPMNTLFGEKLQAVLEGRK
jgi:3'-5' exoribonuclease